MAKTGGPALLEFIEINAKDNSASPASIDANNIRGVESVESDGASQTVIHMNDGSQHLAIETKEMITAKIQEALDPPADDPYVHLSEIFDSSADKTRPRTIDAESIESWAQDSDTTTVTTKSGATFQVSETAEKVEELVYKARGIKRPPTLTT